MKQEVKIYGRVTFLADLDDYIIRYGLDFYKDNRVEGEITFGKLDGDGECYHDGITMSIVGISYKVVLNRTDIYLEVKSDEGTFIPFDWHSLDTWEKYTEFINGHVFIVN